MHDQALDWVRYVSTQIVPPKIVMDQGGRNVNGGIKQFFPTVEKWIAVDITDGNGVDIVADCSTFVLPGCDLVTSTELFEHTPKVPEIIKCAYDSIAYGGYYIVTTAGLNRPPHNAHGASRLEPGEYYVNIDPAWLFQELRRVGFMKVYIDVRDNPSDVRAWCTK